MVWRVTQPLARELRCRIVAKADSMTLVVRRCVQWAAGEVVERNLSTTLRHRRLGFTEQAVWSQPRPAG